MNPSVAVREAFFEKCARLVFRLGLSSYLNSGNPILIGIVAVGYKVGADVDSAEIKSKRRTNTLNRRGSSY